MAQRGAWTPTKVRERIKTSMLLKRLHDHILGKQEVSQTQLKAIEILLKKSLPDLQAIEATHRGDAERPIVIQSADTEL